MRYYFVYLGYHLFYYMRKKILFILLLLGAVIPSQAQRYLNRIFDSVSVQADQKYGFNYGYKGDSTNLLLDVYQGYLDTAINRPMVVLAHGGSFIQGNRKSADIASLCKDLAKRGYVVVSFEYRLGVDILSGKTLEQEFSQAVLRASQDGRAAIRYFYKSARNGNTFRIDTNQIYTGGISAGGVLGLHLAFLNTKAEMASLTINADSLGGVEGNSGNAGYSWNVKGIISLCGALANVSWMNDDKQISLCNMHGTQDATVPYKTDYFKFFGTNVALLQGGFSVDSAAQKQGIDTRLYTFLGADHVPFSGSTATQIKYMDTTSNYVAAYLYKHVTGLIPTSVKKDMEREKNILIYPNPCSEQINFQFENTANRSIKIIDLSGKLMKEINCNRNTFQMDIRDLAKAMYFFEISENGQINRQKIIIE